MRILVTGGAGYVGSHVLLDLLAEGHRICIVDNFSNSSRLTLDRIKNISGCSFECFNDDITNGASIEKICQSFEPDAVLHFAGLKAVEQSNRVPLVYYEKNVNGAIQLLKAMDNCNCNLMVFSSSASVYGTPIYLPYDELHPIEPVNPYGRSKLFTEQIIKDWAKTDTKKSVAILRYFNPVGAHKSGNIGENPSGTPNNLLPYIAQVATGKREKLHIFGNDYDTPDGTGVRDYIHVSDLAEGHLNALDYISKNLGVVTVNLGTGRGHSVFEMLAAFESASGKTINYEIMPRRAGDLDIYFANASKAEKLFGWTSKRGIDEMCQDVWRWQSKNPKGFVD